MLKEEATPARFYRFGDFQLDAAKRLLFKNGGRIALTPKAFDVLLVLVQRHGQIVSKNELLHLVWPDTVVEEVSLTRNISVLRKTLGEKPDEHSFIVTLPGAGYRFVAAVELADDSSARIQQELRSQAAPARRRWPWMVASALLGIAILVVWYFRPVSSPRMWRSVPLTSYPGVEQAPALAPDGSHVAFAWDGEKQDNFDIYIKSIGPGAPLRLTTNPAEDVSPAWSPDGKTIAFLRRMGTDRNELVLIPALRGPERKLAETRSEFRIDLPRPSLAWSPDGRWLAVSDRERDDLAEGLFVVSAQTGHKRRLTTALTGSFGDYMPAFAPDGRSIAFCRFPGYATSEIYVLPLSKDIEVAGEPRRITAAGQGASNPVWTRDANHILYVGPRRELQIIAVSGSQKAESVPLPEDAISELSLGRHLVYSRRTVDNDIWRAELGPSGVPLSVPQRLIASTRSDLMPRYSPDGGKIAFASTRSGAWEIWIAEPDGSNPVPVTSFGGPPGVMAWSPDGRELAFGARPEGQSDLFTIPVAGGARKRLTTDPSDDLTPSYSHDGRWIYFTSKRSGRSEIWRMPSEGGQATQVTHAEGGYMAMESPDGKALFYCHDLPERGIWKVPVEGGKEMQVAGPYSPRLCGLAVTPEGLYYTAAPDSRKHYSIHFVSFSTGKSRPVVVSDRPLGKLSLSVSPDRRFIIYGQADQSGSDLMLIENFDPRPARFRFGILSTLHAKNLGP